MRRRAWRRVKRRWRRFQGSVLLNKGVRVGAIILARLAVLVIRTTLCRFSKSPTDKHRYGGGVGRVKHGRVTLKDLMTVSAIVAISSRWDKVICNKEREG